MAGRQTPLLGCDGHLPICQLPAVCNRLRRCCCRVDRKVAKYSALEDQYIFQPIAVESLGPMNWEARKFLADLGRKISRVSGDDRETTFLFQHISVLLFRFNSVLLHNSFELDDRSEH